MPRAWTDQYTFLAGAVAGPDLAFFVTHDDETASARVPYSSFLTWKRGKDEGEWTDGGTREWPTVSMCAIPGDMTQLLAIGEAGQVFLRGAGEEREEVIVKGDEGPATRGPLRCVRAIAGQVIVVGSDRQVYRRKGPSRWEALDLGARPDTVVAPILDKASEKKKPAGRAPRSKPGPPTKRTSSAASSIGFEAVDGFVSTEIYAVGLHGVIWQFDGTRWQERESPTTETLSQLTCGVDGHVYAAGEKGVLLRGRAELWERLPTGMTQTITGLRVFEGKIYVATEKGVFHHDGDKLVPLALPKKDPPKTFSSLDVTPPYRGPGALWSIGPKDIFTYDGKTWTRIE